MFTFRLAPHSTAMAADRNFSVTREAVAGFLRERGGKARNSDFMERFRAVFPEEPAGKAAARSRFKSLVDDIAFVKAESGVKFVCLRRKFRVPVTDREQTGGHEEAAHRYHAGADPGADPAARRQVCTGDAPGSGYGNDSQVRVPRVFAPPDETGDRSEFVRALEEVGGDSCEMGNTFQPDRRESEREQAGNAPHIPEIAVIEASPLPAEGSPVFALPGPAQSSAAGRVYTGQAESEGPSPEGLQEAEHISVSSGGSQDRRRQADEGEDDAVSLSGSEGSCSPRGSRRRFIQVMMSSSPQVRRSVVLHVSLCPSSRSDSDTLSLVSSNLDEDRTSATLDPLEHEWMMCASDGEWDNMQRLLSAEPSLVLRRDFVTGFTCLHWAAKQGKPELLALIINFSRRHDVPISVDVRSSSGYTPLHIAAMHGHAEVLKLLAGAYNADVEIRDYSGKRACQYLRGDVSADLRDIIGAHGSPESTDRRAFQTRSRFSKVLQSNLRPLRLLGPNDGGPLEAEAGPWDKVVRRKSSFSRMRPKLERLRMRTSQIVHSTTFRDTEELEGPLHGSFRRRPKTHFFG